jgi:hypothetical protein
VSIKSLLSEVLLEGSKEMEIIGPHSTSGTCDWLQHHVWEPKDHPPYTAHNNFHLLRSIPYETPGGEEFATDADMKQAVTSRLQTLDTYFF